MRTCDECGNEVALVTTEDDEALCVECLEVVDPPGEVTLIDTP